MLYDLVFRISLFELAGYTMLHFWWIGALTWLLLIILRRSLVRSSPQTRYAISVMAFCLLICSAVGASCLSFYQIRSQTLTQHDGLAVSGPAVGMPGSTQWLHADSPILTTRVRSPAPFQQLTPHAAFEEWISSAVISPAVTLLPWMWCFGSILMCLLYITGVFGTVSLRRQSSAIEDDEVLKRFIRLKDSLGILGSVALRVCEDLSSPIVVGILRPTILLPPTILTGMTPDQLEMILLHELAHVRRWDNFVNLLQRVFESLLFYHPAIWWASKWVRLEREHCCDSLVLSRNHTPISYAETLAALAMPELSPRFAVAAMANHQLTSRICQILNVEEQTMLASRRSFMLTLTLLLLLIVAGYRTAAAFPRPIPQEQEDSVIDITEEAAIPVRVKGLDSKVFDFKLGFVRSDEDQDEEEESDRSADDTPAATLESEDVDTFTFRGENGVKTFVFADDQSEDVLIGLPDLEDVNEHERLVIQKMIDHLQERLKQLDAKQHKAKSVKEIKVEIDSDDAPHVIERLERTEKTAPSDKEVRQDSAREDVVRWRSQLSAARIKELEDRLHSGTKIEIPLPEGVVEELILEFDEDVPPQIQGRALSLIRKKESIAEDTGRSRIETDSLIQMQKALEQQQAAIEELAKSLKAMQAELSQSESRLERSENSRLKERSGENDIESDHDERELDIIRN